jgi:preprotein translocase subunit SecG
VLYTFLLFIHVLVCVFMTIAILLQSSKGGGLAGAFGGGGTVGAMFGGRGAAPLLSKITIGLGAAFMVLSMTLGLMTRGVMPREKSVVEEERARRESTPASVLPVVPSEQTGGEAVPESPQPQP